jgi:hypothetical protein
MSDESTPVCTACNSLHQSTGDVLSSTTKTRIHPKTPLSQLSNKDLIKEVKASRCSLKDIQARVQSLTNGTYLYS